MPPSGYPPYPYPAPGMPPTVYPWPVPAGTMPTAAAKAAPAGSADVSHKASSGGEDNRSSAKPANAKHELEGGFLKRNRLRILGVLGMIVLAIIAVVIYRHYFATSSGGGFLSSSAPPVGTAFMASTRVLPGSHLQEMTDVTSKIGSGGAMACLHYLSEAAAFTTAWWDDTNKRCRIAQGYVPIGSTSDGRDNSMVAIKSVQTGNVWWQPTVM